MTTFSRSVLALFAIPPDQPLSQETQNVLAIVAPFCTAGPLRPALPIECVVTLRFARTVRDTKPLVDAVIASATRVASKRTTQREVSWVGFHIAGAQSVNYAQRGFVAPGNLRLLHKLCSCLPDTIAFSFGLPHLRVRVWSRRRTTTPKKTTDHAELQFVAFVTKAIGVVGTELTGRLTMLDLRYRSPGQRAELDFARLCTLMPLARSLQSLLVTLGSKEDLLWIVYAATHPLAPATSWRTLTLERQNHSRIEWPQLGHVRDSSSALAALWLLVTPPPVPVTGIRTDDAATPAVRRTAKVASDVLFFTPDKTKTFVQPVSGVDIELCDVVTPLGEFAREPDESNTGDDVAVVVAGVGLGWVHKSHLAQLEDTHLEGTLHPCITKLCLLNHATSAADAINVLALFGPALTQLAVRSDSSALTIGQVTNACPRLESLAMDIPQFGASNATAIPTLRSVCIRAGAGVFQWLHSLPQLRFVRIQLFQSDRATPWSVMDDHLAALVSAKARTLRSVIAISPDSHEALKFAPGKNRGSCDAWAKRALLGVLRRARVDLRSRTALAYFDSDIVRQIFAFAGASMTRLAFQNHWLWPTDWFDSICW